MKPKTDALFFLITFLLSSTPAFCGFDTPTTPQNEIAAQECLAMVSPKKCEKHWGVYDAPVEIGYCLGSEGTYDYPDIARLHCQGLTDCKDVQFRDFGEEGTSCQIPYKPEFFPLRQELELCLTSCKQPFLEQVAFCNATLEPGLFCADAAKEASCHCIYQCFVAFSKGCSDATSGCPILTSKPTKKVPLRNQNDPANGDLGQAACGPTALGMALEYFGINITTPDLIKQMKLPRTGATIWHLSKAVFRHGKGMGFSFGTLFGGKKDPITYLQSKLAKGALVIIPVFGDYTETLSAGEGHFLLATEIKDGSVFANDPASGCPVLIPLERLRKVWQSYNGRHPAVVINPD
ncbi:MAG: hypothetical protein GX606_04330 [Elusimicrobia bacterium]|nr:hypothetical protein [Elusimicrobiota bacterium]